MKNTMREKMTDSERMQRIKRDTYFEENDSLDNDKELAERILLLLNDDRIDKFCMVDAYYYDYSTIPDEVLEEHQIYRDAYLIFGISHKAEFISKWVDRWELDSNDPIVDGKVVKDTNAKYTPYAFFG